MREEWLKSECPCGLGETFEKCCDLFINGKAKAPTAEKLMRSRYSAFVVGEPDYIFETHDPETRSEVNFEEIKTWSNESDWEGLKIVSTENGQVGETTGIVEFIANYSVKQKARTHHEKSEFNFKDDMWYFTNGELINETVRRVGPKVGRNDPCPCDSGKKFKKCCG